MVKAPLMLGANLQKLTAAQLAVIKNKDVIAVNQDDAGVQAKKLAVDGVPTPRFVGLAPCDAGSDMGYNGVSAASLRWKLHPAAAAVAAATSAGNWSGALPGLAEPSNSNRRCGSVDGANDTSSPMCEGSTPDGRLGVDSATIRARCGADATCVGYAQWVSSGSTYYRPVTRATSVNPAEKEWITFLKTASPPAGTVVLLENTETGRCLTMGTYASHATAPLLVPCNASDAAQAWVLPTATNGSIGGLLWLPATQAQAPAALTVGESTLYSTVHGDDPVAVPDGNYGNFNITLAEYAPESPCSTRSCDDYTPAQMWYFSPRLGTISLGAMSANDYRCYGSGCYKLTGHVNVGAQFCLSHVLSYDANSGTEPQGSSVAGSDVWGGPLAGGDFVMGLVNRHNTGTIAIEARWAWLEASGVGDSTCFTATELFSGEAYGSNIGGITISVPRDDMAMLRLVKC